MFNPVATYRIQFHKDFTFKDLDKVLPYLIDLGVSTIYASPIFSSTPGSTHGYDGVNPHEINPEIGTLEELRAISKKLKANGIGWLQDIVPNHMAYHPNNPWLMDVLEKGNVSNYQGFFDQSLTDGLYKGRIMVPFLGSDLDELIDKEEIKIAWNGQRLVFQYAENTWPIKLASYITILDADGITPPTGIKQLTDQIDQVLKIDAAAAFSPAADEIKLQLEFLAKEDAVKQYFDACLDVINKDKEQLKNIAGQQYYRLCSWQETDSVINYRRFFTVNGLICLNIHNEEVFEHYHRFILELIREDIFQGLRVDHIDGLYDPGQYLERLRKLAGDDAYLIVEKILEPGEEMLGTWPVQGNTGYDFLAQVNNLFTNTKSKAAFTNFYKKLTGNKVAIYQQIEDKKRLILTEHMGGELDNLTELFLESGFVNDKQLKGIAKQDLKQTIAEFLIKCPVYRFYGNEFPLSEQENGSIQKIFQRIRESNSDLAKAVNLFENLLLKKQKQSNNAAILHFYQRCMQFAGPVMAKGVEDTLMYTYNRFIDHNEVGDSPGTFGIEVDKFHELMETRQQQWPLSMNGTSTHDTKRGEDVRTRLNVLSEIAEEWLQMVETWQQMNAGLKQHGAPDDNDEFFIYQTMIGAYPMPNADDIDFLERMEQYLEKTLREAKLHSGWAEPNEPYEAGAKAFVKGLLDIKRPFWKSFRTFHDKVASYGVINSLSQLLLKFTCPGMPDVYQGCEHWDLSLVDPDNRRPVDYQSNKKLLKQTKGLEDDVVTSLWKNKFSGEIKIWLTNKLLNIRKQHPNLFKDGKYIPLKVEGAYKANLIAFARRHKLTWYITIVPLGIAGLCADGQDVNNFDWEDTKVIIPGDAPGVYENLLSGKTGKQQGEIKVADLFIEMPLALLKLEHPKTVRSSGILMHVTSLPSPYGIGDFGKEARQFADKLYAANQKYWQMLPINPVSDQYQYSPYSSHSSLAGNVLLISPQLLADEGLIDNNFLYNSELKASAKVNFQQTEQVKKQLFDEAWVNFKAGHAAHLQAPFDEFCKEEAYWLDDYALYMQIKAEQGGKPWYEWPAEFKNKQPKALTQFAETHQLMLDQTKWLQFIFSKQWNGLKNYCHELEIQLIGDLPFYVSYDSVDVWSHPDIFSLDKDSNLELVAGVPPDYFNADGQLWGMPVYRWDKLKQQTYSWWITRIKKNIQYFDLIRLDHFRAFANYWAVPATEETAINGSWEPGPGSDFFNALKKEFGQLPFVAEDLGDINEAVNQLRDEFNLPGMKVLQFAFGNDLPFAPYIPHNYTANFFAYSGTHDNNTTLGWYRQDADEDTRIRIEQYTGLKVKEKNIHKVFIKLLMASAAQTVIFPVQDLLGLDESARMNVPADTEANWLWRLTDEQLEEFPIKKLKKLTSTYNRV